MPHMLEEPLNQILKHVQGVHGMWVRHQQCQQIKNCINVGDLDQGAALDTFSLHMPAADSQSGQRNRRRVVHMPRPFASLSEALSSTSLSSPTSSLLKSSKRSAQGDTASGKDTPQERILISEVCLFASVSSKSMSSGYEHGNVTAACCVWCLLWISFSPTVT